MRLATKANLAWLIAYLATITALVFTIVEVRQRTLASFDTTEQRALWDEWKRKAPQAGQSHKNPVKHPQPKADEPPALLLMRDHFPVVMTAGVIFGSLLFGATMVFIRGIFARKRE